MRHHFVRSSAGLRDPNFKNVTLLLHGDGTNGAQNNTFLDSSGSNNAITRTGNVVQGSFSPYGDRWSNYFDGTGDDLTLTGQNLSATDWTVECWVYFQSFSNNAPHLWNFGTDVNNRFNVWRNSTTGTFSFTRVNGGSYDIKNGTTSPVVGRWYHVAVVRVNSTGVHTLYIDGVPEVTNTGSITGGTTWTIGFVPTGGLNDRMLGYISNLRVVTSAIYTTNFTPPTAPLSAIANTSLLTCSTNRFRDASTNNRTITRNGDVSVQRFSPFSPDAQYRTDRIGGSAYFDGSSDWLFVANRALKLTAGFFTAECWVYLDSFPGNDFFGYTIFSDYYWTGGNTGGYFVNIGSNQKVNLYASSGVFGQQAVAILSSNNSIALKQWNHIAIVRGGGNLINIYINGVSTTTPVARTSLSLLSGGAANLESRIGVRLHDVWYGPPGDAYGPFIGTISDLRVINGKCLYTANFTPPTEPLTAIPETTFLGRFANGSIVDNAMMANLETLGNAQIDTTIKKFGTGSLEFDGTGDYLTVLNNPAFSFGTGDFTIECWVYIAANSSPDGSGNRTAGLFSAYAASGVVSRGYTFEIEGNASTTGTGLSFYNNNSGTQISLIATTTISQGTWHHVAVCRSGTTTRLFLNGSSVASGTLSNQNVNSDYPITIGRLGYASYLQEFNGYIDDLRVTKGIARYTSNFTPPTAPFPDF